MANESDKKSAEVFWQGDSREVQKSFPRDIQIELGRDIRRVQDGKLPLDSKPMKSIGAGVFELRQQDRNGWYRLIYLKKIGDRVFMLHSFVKKSAKTSPRDLNIATNRLKEVQAMLAKEKNDAKKNK